MWSAQRSNPCAEGRRHTAQEARGRAAEWECREGEDAAAPFFFPS